MTKTTITKFFVFVIFFTSIGGIFSGCFDFKPGRSVQSKNTNYEKPKTLGKITDPDITESSGLAASKCQPNVFWTHNDSGDDAFIYALSSSGESLGTWKVPGARNIDWEDIAEYKDNSGKCLVYIGEIGDNRSRMSEHVIYRVREPSVSQESAHSNRKNPLVTESTEALHFSYPDGAHDAETLMVHPITADIYVVTKRLTGAAGVYRLRPDFATGQAVLAEKIAELSVPAIPNGFVTGGDISPDGRRMIICDYAAGYEFTLPENSSSFDEIWKQEPEIVDLGDRRVGEAVCYTPDGNALYATSEGKNAPMIEIRRKR